MNKCLNFAIYVMVILITSLSLTACSQEENTEYNYQHADENVDTPYSSERIGNYIIAKYPNKSEMYFYIIENTNQVAIVNPYAYGYDKKKVNYLSKDLSTIYARAKGKDREFKQYTGRFFIPSKVTLNDTIYNVTAIGYNAFYESDITSVFIPEDIIYIGDGAFSECKHLAAVNLPIHLTEINNNVFKNCSYLKDVHMSSNILSIGEFAFGGCSDLEEINLPNNLQTISNAAFYESGLTNVNLPQTMTALDNYVFYGCKNLASINIHENITVIGAATFEGCTNLNAITISDKVNTIGADAFKDCNITEEHLKHNGIVALRTYYCSFPKGITLYVPNAHLADYKAKYGSTWNFIGE